MSADFQIPRNTLLPILTATLSDANGVINLTGLTVKFQMRLPGSSVLKVDSAAALVGGGTGGQVSYTWQDMDTDTAGLYLAWFQVTSATKTFGAPEPPLIIEVTRGAGP